MKTTNPLWLACLPLIGVLQAGAQKLPNKQAASIWAPENLKIDGRADEWGALQAHNNATGLYYTMANDANNLYLVVQAKDPRLIEKILDVSINLTISPKGNKQQKNDPAIIYPNINYNYVHGILVNAGTKAYWSGRPRNTFSPSAEVLTRTDSSVMNANRLFSKQSTQIKIFNLKGMTDTLIAVDNKLQIKAAASFDMQGIYTYEMAVPLKYLGLLNEGEQAFSYTITLKDWGNAMFSSYRDMTTRETRDADPDLNSTTDFKAEYTLKKKP